MRGWENLPRISFGSLSSKRIFVSFPTSATPLTWDGVELNLGDFVFHSRGERLHQRTTGEGRWGLISLLPKQLAFSSTALTGQRILPPAAGRVLRPPHLAATRLLRLHSKAHRLLEISPELIVDPGIARALEQELLHALINCLATDDTKDHAETRRHHANIMVRFEDALRTHTGRLRSMPELSAAIGVPERTLRICCAEFLGMSPTRYLLLRRLNMARAALRLANPATESVAKIARSYQFSEPGRFAVTYRTIFGETPSTTLRHSRLNRRNCQTVTRSQG
jgi:AraC-like DNA-binding protein